MVAFGAGIDGEFFGGEVLLAIHLAIDNPPIYKTFLARVGDGNGFEVMMLLEFRVHVFLPVELLHDEIDVVVLRSWACPSRVGSTALRGPRRAFDTCQRHPNPTAAHKYKASPAHEECTDR